MFRKCGSCFRYIEDWRDAEAKGLTSRDLNGINNYAKKPRIGVVTKCCATSKGEAKATEQGCKYHQYRWSWNIKQWWDWSFKYKLSRWFSVYIRCPIGALRKPVPLEWVDSFDGTRDRIIPQADPECPHCGEMPYSYEQCVFCGQRFIQDEKTVEMSKPAETEHMDCFICGGKSTMEFTRAKCNGHKHGKCTACGAKFIE